VNNETFFTLPRLGYSIKFIIMTFYPGCVVGGKMSDSNSNLSKISDSDLLT